MKKKVLLVDDDNDLCQELQTALTATGHLEVMTAANGFKAMEILFKNNIDMVVTDIQMPEMDGFALIAYLTRHHENVPFIIMTAHDVSQIDQKLGSARASSVMRKPFKAGLLVDQVLDTIGSAQKGMLCGISVAPFLQLLEMERKTCTLHINSKGKEGSLFIAYGNLIDAQFEEGHGERAAMEIIGWDTDVAIEIEDVCRSSNRTIEKDLRYLIMESLRMVDESTAKGESPREVDLNDLGSLDGDSERDKDRSSRILVAIPHERHRNIEAFLTGLGEIKGVKGVALINTLGEVLLKVTMNRALNMDEICRTFGPYVPSPFGFPAGQVYETVFRTSSQIILVFSAGRDASFGFHLIVVIGEENAEGLVKLRLRRLMPKIMAKLYAVESTAPEPPV